MNWNVERQQILLWSKKVSYLKYDYVIIIWAMNIDKKNLSISVFGDEILTLRSSIWPNEDDKGL